MKTTYFFVLSLLSFNSQAVVEECDFQNQDLAVYQIIKPTAPFDSCKKAISGSGAIGYKLIKGSSFIEVLIEDKNFTHEEHFLASGQILTIEDLYLAIYSPKNIYTNEYIEAQKKNILKSAYNGIKFDKSGSYFFTLKTEDSAYKNYITYIKKDEPNERVVIGTDGSMNLMLNIIFNGGNND